MLKSGAGFFPEGASGRISCRAFSARGHGWDYRMLGLPTEFPQCLAKEGRDASQNIFALRSDL
jgi:hypothetical protein